MNEPKYITIPQAAQKLGITKQALYRRFNDNKELRQRYLVKVEGQKGNTKILVRYQYVIDFNEVSEERRKELENKKRSFEAAYYSTHNDIEELLISQGIISESSTDDDLFKNIKHIDSYIIGYLSEKISNKKKMNEIENAIKLFQCNSAELLDEIIFWLDDLNKILNNEKKA